jgi:hypothetical protein
MRTSLVLLFTGLLAAQTVQVPSPKQGRPGEILPFTRFRPRTDPYKPTAEEKQKIQAKIDELGGKIRDLRTRRVEDSLLVDVEIFHEAARWILTFPEEFSRKEMVASTLDVLEQGSERAAQLKEGKSPWTTQKGRLIRGYRSDVDGSVQPYRLTIPDEYDGTRALPLDVIEHGRYVARYEVEFIAAFPKRGADRPHLPGTIQIELFGRGNNAFHWPGEADIFEGIAAVSKSYKVDPDRIALRGFSMGGAGVWHSALHHPGLWATVEAGAGDTESHRMRVLPDLAPHQQAMCRIFDNTYEWMLNAFNMPFIGYVGEIDGSFAKHVAARLQLAREGFHFDGLSFTTGLRVTEVPRSCSSSRPIRHTRRTLSSVRAWMRFTSRISSADASLRTACAFSPTRPGTIAATGRRWTAWRSTTSARRSTPSAPTIARSSTLRRRI